jgi:hypothetical protein
MLQNRLCKGVKAMASVVHLSESFTPDSPLESSQKPHFPRVGQAVCAAIPRYDGNGRYLSLETRRVVIIDAVEDLGERFGYSCSSVARTPFLRRGQFRFRYWCKRTLKRRYAFLDTPGDCALQLGVIDIQSQKLLRLVGDPFQQIDEDLEDLAATCRNVMRDSRLDGLSTSVAVFPIPRWQDDDRVTLTQSFA